MRRSFIIDDDEMRRINVIADRVIRRLIEVALIEYEKEYGEIPIEGVSPYSWSTHPSKRPTTLSDAI